MILVDANLLLYATIRDYPQHDRARRWLEAQFQSTEPVGLPWPSLLAFVRIATNKKLFPSPLSTRQAFDYVVEWLALPETWIPVETEQHAQILEGLLIATAATGNLVSDCHLAALAIEHGLMLCSADSDFSHMPRLSFHNPLAPRP